MPTATRTTRVLSLSIPPRLLQEAERFARREGRTRSELFREALRRYLAEAELRELRRYGSRQARKLGFKPSAVERLIQEYRRNR